MKNPLHKKLASNSGAAITIAILLFLVCAVMGTIVLRSATTSVGRLVDLAESDQRYYSVMSAADLIVDALDGQMGIVKYSRSHYEGSVTTIAMNEESGLPQAQTTYEFGTSSSSADNSPEYTNSNVTFRLNDNLTTENKDAIVILNKLSRRLILNQESLEREKVDNVALWATNIPVYSSPDSLTRYYELKVMDGTDAISSVYVDLNFSGSNQTATFVVSSEGDNPYSVKIVLKPTITYELETKETKESKDLAKDQAVTYKTDDDGKRYIKTSRANVYVNSDENAARAVIESKKVTETKTIYVTWNVIEVKKGQ